MTHAVVVPDTTHISERFSKLVSALGHKRADRRNRSRARRTALAMSEEARIAAQMRYRRMRYRHVAG